MEQSGGVQIRLRVPRDKLRMDEDLVIRSGINQRPEVPLQEGSVLKLIATLDIVVENRTLGLLFFLADTTSDE